MALLTTAAITAFLSEVPDLVKRFIPDPEQAAKLEHEIRQSAAEHAHTAAQAQVGLNQIEAQHGSRFVAGWRPFIGWVCGAGLAYQFLVRPLLSWLTSLLYAILDLWVDGLIPLHTLLLPTLDTGTLIALVTGMLGFGGYRSYEKINGVARNVDPVSLINRREEENDSNF